MADRLKLILVDDETAITSNLAPFLERAGFAVTVCANGEQAGGRKGGAEDSRRTLVARQGLGGGSRGVRGGAGRGRPPLAASTRLASANLLLDRTARRAWLDGQPLTLTPKAIALLEYLMT